jgi:hypothetical protein
MRSGSKLPTISRLDPVKDHQQIVHLDCCYEFPFDFTRSLEFALFRTYCVPSISGLLRRTGEFSRCPQKRYDDTDILLSALMEWGYDSEQGNAALVRMNAIHGLFEISNEDYLYVLSTFVFEPSRWIDQFGWRPMTQREKLALFHFWRAVGKRMGIRDIPESYDDFEHFNCQFERTRFRFDEANRHIGNATMELFASWFPWPLRPLVRRVIHAMLDERTREAFGLPAPSPWLRALAKSGLRLRALFLRLLPVRARPRLRTHMRHPTYPDGYRIDAIAPTYFRE